MVTKENSTSSKAPGLDPHQADVVQGHTQDTSSIRSIDATLTDITRLGQSGPGSNGNEGVLHIPQSSRTEAFPSDGSVSHPGHLLGRVGLTSL